MMSDALMIEGLCKAYPDFYLEGVSFSVKRGGDHGIYWP